MISDTYSDESAEMLYKAGYMPGYVADIREGDEIAIMHHEYPDGESTDVVEFSTVLAGVQSSQLRGEDGPIDSYIIRFVAQSDKGFPKHHSYNGSWGIYIKRGGE